MVALVRCSVRYAAGRGVSLPTASGTHRVAVSNSSTASARGAVTETGTVCAVLRLILAEPEVH